MDNGLYQAMKKEMCAQEFIIYATNLLRYKEIDWAAWETSISQHAITVRLLDGHTISITE